jgi:peptidoglycan/xylan/chitin deacetylase (PgdA/CDA1 family)
MTVDELPRSESLDLPPWPEGHEVAVSLTFDVDGESVAIGESSANARRLSLMSDGRYGVTRGLPRIRALLAEENIHGTFFVPGWVADKYGSHVRGLAEDEHEIGHHGYLHRNPEDLDLEGQTEELQHGLDSLVSLFGGNPVGYRAPYFAPTCETFSLLQGLGFIYDSSCMGDHQPYLECCKGIKMLELPVHWSLDDGVYYAWTPQTGALGGPNLLFDTWFAEFNAIASEGGHLVLTMHPHWTGRPHQLETLHRLIREMRRAKKVWFTPLLQVAELYQPRTKD